MPGRRGGGLAQWQGPEKGGDRHRSIGENLEKMVNYRSIVYENGEKKGQLWSITEKYGEKMVSRMVNHRESDPKI